ncbi:hypothetical protein RYX36_033155 [Vicia faba]
MVGKNDSSKERNRDWIRELMNSSSGYCVDHRDFRSNENNTFCVDCAVRMCRHCKEAHSMHTMFQIYRYSYQDVFRHSDLHNLFDCSNIQTYISNNERIVHLKPRPPIYKSKPGDQCPESKSKSKESNLSARFKLGGTTCEECGKHLQDERSRWCSIICKISALPLEPQNQGPNHHTKKSLVFNQSGRCTITPKIEAIDFTMSDNLNSEPESSISEAEPCGRVEVVNFRKRPRKTPPQRPHFVFIS